MARGGTASIQEDDSALEESAREKLGVDRWDRPVIFRETADAATDVRLPYWSLLVLSGSIATLGLALDNAAVVIGAMLIAPLLAPTMGLALALAVGDVRLASQTAFAVIGSTAIVIAAAAVLTLVLPFQTITAEISARTRPTTLDLGIAVFSGLAGAVVSVTRRKGLSAAIPGVAVAVALIPPLAVAGFAVGAGFRWSLIKGSMLLYGANLAGIVFSGTLVYLLIGMHRPSIVDAARNWHQQVEPARFAAWAASVRWFPTIGPIRSPVARIGIVLVFVAALAIPLTITLGEIARETRVQRAINAASEMFVIEGRSSILSRRSVIGETETQALLRVATTEWFDDEAREQFEVTASAQAGERVRLVLEQLPTTSGDLDQMAALFPSREHEATPRSAGDLNSLIAPATARIREVVDILTLPENLFVAGFELSVGGIGRRSITVGYVADKPMSDDVTEILTRQLRAALTAANLDVAWDRVPTDTLSLAGSPADSSRLREAASLLHRYDGLHLVLLADTSGNSAPADSTIWRLLQGGVQENRIELRHEDSAPLRIVARPIQQD